MGLGIKAKSSCPRSFKDAKNDWLRLRLPRRAWKNAKPKPIGSGGAIPMMNSAVGDGAGRPFKRPFGVPEDKAQDNFTDPQSRIMKMGDSLRTVLQRPGSGRCGQSADCGERARQQGCG